MLGVMNKTNDNPNKRLIEAIVKFYSRRIKASGMKSTTSERESNGGYGVSSYDKLMYDDNAVEFIRGRIQSKCSEYPVLQRFSLCGVDFRLKNPEDWGFDSIGMRKR
ncbi:hypothetical protein D3C71_1493070 [compost metagenome]